MSWIALAGYAGPILRILFFLDRIQRNLVVLPRSKNLLFHAWSYPSILILYTEIRQCSVPEAPSDDGMEYVKRPVAEPDPEEMILAEAIIPKIPPAHVKTYRSRFNSARVRLTCGLIRLREIDESGRRNTHDDTLEVEIGEAGTRK